MNELHEANRRDWGAGAAMAGIHRAAATDLPQVYEFELAYIREIEPQQEERWREAIGGLLRQWTTNLGRMWFAESEGRVIGYCFWEPEKEAAVLSSIYVPPAERQHGWGRRLLTRFEEDAAQCGHRQFSLGVQQTNPARLLYEQCGYQLAKHDGDCRHYVKAAVRRSALAGHPHDDDGGGVEAEANLTYRQVGWLTAYAAQGQAVQGCGG